MEKYTVKEISRVITTNTTVFDKDFSGWFAVNNGNVDVIINKITVPPGKGIDRTDVPPYVTWDSPIQVLVPTGGEVVFSKLIYKPEKEKR